MLDDDLTRWFWLLENIITLTGVTRDCMLNSLCTLPPDTVRSTIRIFVEEDDTFVVLLHIKVIPHNFLGFFILSFFLEICSLAVLRP